MTKSDVISKQPVRFIAHITVNDVDGYRRYGREFFPVPKP
jgi:hypothetical protein